MNTPIVPDLVVNPERFAAAAAAAAAHIVRQPRTISKPIAVYGGLIATGTRPTAPETTEFFRAFFASGAQSWTQPLTLPQFERQLTLLEDAIAQNVYREMLAQNLIPAARLPADVWIMEDDEDETEEFIPLQETDEQ